MPTEIIEFRKKPILRLTDKDNPKIRLQFGAAKAKLIIDHYQDITIFLLQAIKDQESRQAQEKQAQEAQSATIQAGVS